MKIEIKWTSSVSASLKIQGRKMRVEMYPAKGLTRLEGIDDPELSETLGGILAQNLFSMIGNAMQAWAAALEDRPGETEVTWEPLSDKAIRDVEDKFF